MFFVNVRSNSCGQNLGITCLPIPGTGQEVTPLCPTALSSCNGGIYTGIQEWVYEGVITLPMQCTDWTFSYNLCCRNAAINTITTPSSNTFYIYATLNNTISPCNSSPTFLTSRFLLLVWVNNIASTTALLMQMVIHWCIH
ncbi:MAG: hypothetical protein IPP71_21110 [Bacteroidetes bacterium]|nr:hypothetical protein [Bacteroidota bacterium]